MGELEDWIKQPMPLWGPNGTIWIPVTDLPRAIEFYGVLGIRVTEATDSIAKLDGKIPMHLRVACKGSLPPGVRLPRSQLTLFKSGIREAAERLAAAGIPIVKPYAEDESGLGAVTVADPDGNLITLQGKPDRVEPPESNP